MSKRKVWTQEQDIILKNLKEERGLKKWSEIAKTMEEQFGIASRTGKQCRQRYHNHLDVSIVASSWAIGEEQTLYNMHIELGNKWSQISKQLPGRSDNCIKNHFYSKLRKSIRKLNRVIQQSRLREWRQISLPFLNKIVEITQQRFNNGSKYQEDVIDKSLQIVNALFRFDFLAKQSPKQFQAIVKRLIEDVMWLQGKLTRSPKWNKQHQVTHESRQLEGRCKSTESEQIKQEPFYQILKRVCDQIMLNNN